MEVLAVPECEDVVSGESRQIDAIIGDYILGTDPCCFEMVVIRGVRNEPPDHFAIRARLLIYTTKEGKNFGTGGILDRI